VRGLRDQGFDHIVVELSGVADPSGVQAALRAEGLATARTVAVVCAESFPDNFQSSDAIMERPEMLRELFEAQAALSVDSAVVELLLSQLEAADLLLVNKCDRASERAVQATVAACHALNDAAEVVQTSFGEVDLDVLLPPRDANTDAAVLCGRSTPGDDASAAAAGAGARSAASLGFRSFVYSARRPFAASRLSSLLATWPLPAKDLNGIDALTPKASEPVVEAVAMGAEAAGAAGAAEVAEAAAGAAAASPFSRVLRSKGVAWLDRSYTNLISWSHAGRHLSIEEEQCWWAVLSDEQMREVLGRGRSPSAAEALYNAELRAFDRTGGVYGDRRQEIVFIGTRLDEKAIRAEVRHPPPDAVFVP